MGNQSHPVELAHSRKRVLRGRRRRRLRSVDSECAGHVLSLESLSLQEPTSLPQRGPCRDAELGLAFPILPGSKTMAGTHWGSPGT